MNKVLKLLGFTVCGLIIFKMINVNVVRSATLDKVNDSIIQEVEEERFQGRKKGSSTDKLSFDLKYIADGFDFPVGKPNAKGYYNAQAFGKNNHLGDDWNSVKRGNTDLGDPIYTIANGYVKFAEGIGGGWGNVIRVLHQLPDGKRYESLYAHCDSIIVQAGNWLQRGQQIGTIGTANGRYFAHLHLEIRDNIDLPVGGGYSDDQTGYLDPTKFIHAHRKINH